MGEVDDHGRRAPVHFAAECSWHTISIMEVFSKGVCAGAVLSCQLSGEAGRALAACL